MDKKKYIIIGAVVAVAVVVYLIKSKLSAASTDASAEESTEEKAANAAKRSVAAAASKAQGSISNVEMTAEDEEYNLARQKYYNLTGKYPSSTWSLSIINQQIEEYEKKSDAVKQYISLVSSSTYATDEHTDDMTLKEIEALIEKAQNQIDAGKKAERTTYLKELVSRFKATLQAPNYKLMSATKRNAWDTSTLNEMLKLSTDEKKEFNSLFAAAGGSGKIPDYFNQASSKWRNRLTVYDAIVSGNANTGRTGASVATQVKKAFQSL